MVYVTIEHIMYVVFLLPKLLEKKQIVAILLTNWPVLNITKGVSQWQCVCARQENSPSL